MSELDTMKKAMTKYITLYVSDEGLKKFNKLCEDEKVGKSHMFSKLLNRYLVCMICPFNNDVKEIRDTWKEIIKILKESKKNNKKK